MESYKFLGQIRIEWDIPSARYKNYITMFKYDRYYIQIVLTIFYKNISQKYFSNFSVILVSRNY